MLPYIAAVYFLAWIILFILGFIYKRRLRRLYPDIAARFYPPLMKKTMTDDLRGAGFLLRGHFRQLDNKEFMRFCEFYRGWAIGAYSLLIVAGAMIILKSGTAVK